MQIVWKAYLKDRFGKRSSSGQGWIQPARLGGIISVIFGGQVWLRVHYKIDEVTSQHFCA